MTVFGISNATRKVERTVRLQRCNVNGSGKKFRRVFERRASQRRRSFSVEPRSSDGMTRTAAGA
jgi:hypothetical protein